MSFYGSTFPGSNIHDLITCPYNPSHQVGASRFQNHLVKCAKQHPELVKQMTICPYNQSHHVFTNDLDSHLSVCREYEAHLLHSLNTGAPEALESVFSKPVGPAPAAPKPEEEEKKKKSFEYYDEADIAEWI